MADDFSNENLDDIFGHQLTRADVREEAAKLLRDIGSFTAQAQASVSNAIREVTAAHPDFSEQRPRMLATLEQLPILKDAISAAENNPQLAPTLSQLYEIAYRTALASPASNTTATSEPSKVESPAGDLSDEGTQYEAALASQKVDLSPANRKALLSELERKGVLDIEF
jgi:hypothetical protein